MSDVVETVLEAIRSHEWGTVRVHLHPYMHWSAGDGTRVRGRRNVLAMLQAGEPPAEPTSYELREGQIYRWDAAGQPR